MKKYKYYSKCKDCKGRCSFYSTRCNKCSGINKRITKPTKRDYFICWLVKNKILTQQEIGTLFGITRQAVSKVNKKYGKEN